MFIGQLPLSEKKYTIRELRLEELPQLIELWKKVGFMVSEYCIRSLWQSDPSGIYGAVSDGGEILGSCCSPFLGESMAKLCFHGVRPEYRLQGLGTQLCDKAMEHVGDCNVFTLCIPEHEHIYVNRYQLNVSPRVFQILGPGIPRMRSVLSSVPGITLVELTPGLKDALMEYDNEVSGYSRFTALEHFVQEPAALVRVALRDDNQIAGFGIISESIHGPAIVRTICADAPDIAEMILGHLFKHFATVWTHGVWMVSCIQTYETHNVLKKFGLKSIHEMKLLRRRPVFDNDLARVYAAY
ncbi:uncharacterized protein LOC135366108 isoform X2 [Ornithodoros turicata]|uniref:uncharacterized protein LOC135366108 isoform X2 n=1 Tax=Ornithodoros turicata TaxID=34597 RepID=UPI00313992AB